MYKNNQLKCDMNETCENSVSHIDHKGYVYCMSHGETRKLYARCRKLKPAELKRLQLGQPLKKY